MCLIAFAIGVRADCPLLIVSNRDEYWDRPTQPLSAWQTPAGTTVYSGRDERAGGTWMGFSADGRVAMLTNVRTETPEVAPRSRGELVTRWLDGRSEAFIEHMTEADPTQYAGCNLVLGDERAGIWHWLTNRRPADGEATSDPMESGGWWGRRLSPGVYGLSNAALDTPWPKTVFLKEATRRALAQDPFSVDTVGRLLEVLTVRGVPDQRDIDPLAAPFVAIGARRYGTRSSLIARVRRQAGDSELELCEWTHDPPGQAADPARYRRISISTWGMPTSR